MTEPGADLRVLVVDDDPLALAAHTTYVDRVPGYTVTARAATGAEALRVLSTTGIDLVLLDVHLPDLSGLEVLRRLRATGHTTDVIMVTRARDLEVVRAAVALGAVAYLVKPFTAATVRARLQAHLDYGRRLDDAGPVIAQSDVDALLSARRAPATVPDLPKNVSRESLDQVVAVLSAAETDGTTAAEVADRLAVSRITARRYLEHLVVTGLARRDLRYGGPGRPQVVYRWQPDGVAR